METISAEVPDELKRAVEEEDINVTRIVREALEAAVRGRRRERLAAEAEVLGRKIRERIDVDTVVDELIDETRSAREGR